MNEKDMAEILKGAERAKAARDIQALSQLETRKAMVKEIIEAKRAERDKEQVLRSEPEKRKSNEPARNKGGRPDTFTEANVDRLLAAIKGGLNLKQACVKAGICESTLSTWRKEHPAFVAQLEAAREEEREMALTGLKAAAPKDWRAYEALLKFSFWQDYVRNPQVNVSANASIQAVVVTPEQRARIIETREQLLGRELSHVQAPVIEAEVKELREATAGPEPEPNEQSESARLLEEQEQEQTRQAEARANNSNAVAATEPAHDVSAVATYDAHKKFVELERLRLIAEREAVQATQGPRRGPLGPTPNVQSNPWPDDAGQGEGFGQGALD